MKKYSITTPISVGVFFCLLSIEFSAICVADSSKGSSGKSSEAPSQAPEKPDKWDNLSVQSFQGAHTNYTSEKGCLVGVLVSFRAKHAVEFAKEDEFHALLYGEPSLKREQGEPLKTTAWDVRLRNEFGSSVRCDRIHIDRGDPNSIGYHFRAPRGTKIAEGKSVQGSFVFQMPEDLPESQLQGSQFTFTVPGYKPILLRFPQVEVNLRLEKAK